MRLFNSFADSSEYHPKNVCRLLRKYDSDSISLSGRKNSFMKNDVWILYMPINGVGLAAFLVNMYF